ncbi:MAG: hypothetical protein ACRDPY_06155 [Streptosporangiaceae bacterium]
MRGELDRVVLVVVPRAQVDGVALAAVLGQAEDVHEESQARLGLSSQQLDVPDVPDVMPWRPRGRRVLRTRHQVLHRC